MEIAVVVTFRPDLLGRLARWTGLAHWTHAALFYETGRDGLRVIESSVWGVRERDWVSFANEWPCASILRPTITLPEILKREILAYAWGNVGKPYAFMWLVLVAWRLIKRRWITSAFIYRRHICSSLVYEAFLYGDVDLLPGRDDILVTPDDLAASPILRRSAW